MNKVLIYLQEGALAKTGGPIGYNYALKTQLDKLGVNHIKFLPGGKPFRPGLGKKIKDTWYGSILKSIKDFFRWSKVIYGKSHEPMVDFNDYDVIHFHGCYTMYSVRDALEGYKGKVVLTSHAPQAGYKEIMCMMTPWNQKHMQWYFKQLEKCDIYAFNRADYIVFPCEDAEEPYFNTWDKFAGIKKQKSDRFRYVATGTYECKAKLSRKDICEKYNIPQDAFIVCYVGRHNEIKGYDKLKQIGEKFLSQYDNAYFLIAGEESPIKGIDHPRWIEAGWTNDPHSIIAASDVFVLPNKETYFDLIMLEVLSLGKIVVASNTGGNKFFKDKIEGVMTYGSISEAVEKIMDVANMSEEKRRTIELVNKKYFQDNLSLGAFADNYIKLYQSL